MTYNDTDLFTHIAADQRLLQQEDASPDSALRQVQPSLTRNGNLARPKVFECPECDVVHASPANLRTHMREKHTHEKPYHCQLCREQGIVAAFARPWSATRHLGGQLHNISKNQRTQYVMFFDYQTMSLSNFGEGTPVNDVTAQALASSGQYITALAPAGPGEYVTAPVPLPEPPVYCMHCYVAYDNTDTVLIHSHNAHGVECSNACSCTICQIIYPTLDSEPSAAILALYKAEGWNFELSGEEPEDVAAWHAKVIASLNPSPWAADGLDNAIVGYDQVLAATGMDDVWQQEEAERSMGGELMATTQLIDFPSDPAMQEPGEYYPFHNADDDWQQEGQCFLEKSQPTADRFEHEYEDGFQPFFEMDLDGTLAALQAESDSHQS